MTDPNPRNSAADEIRAKRLLVGGSIVLGALIFAASFSAVPAALNARASNAAERVAVDLAELAASDVASTADLSFLTEPSRPGVEESVALTERLSRVIADPAIDLPNLFADFTDGEYDGFTVALSQRGSTAVVCVVDSGPLFYRDSDYWCAPLTDLETSASNEPAAFDGVLFVLSEEN